MSPALSVFMTGSVIHRAIFLFAFKLVWQNVCVEFLTLPLRIVEDAGSNLAKGTWCPN